MSFCATTMSLLRPILGKEDTIMLKARETEEIRRIKRWYDQITQGLRPTKAELESQFRGYVDQAALLIQRIDEGQPWEDFKLGIEGAPAGLLRRLSK
jgi:hypothetical protein